MDFVAEGSPMPAGHLDSANVQGRVAKLGMILGRRSRVAALGRIDRDKLFEAHLRRVIRDGEDTALLGTAAAVAGTRPAGLLNGKTGEGGGSPLSIADDVADLWRAVRDGEPDRPYFITSGAGAMYLASHRQTDGSATFPNVSAVGGGSIAGVPQLVSKAAGAKLILVDASAIGVTDGGLVLDASQYASVELDSAPVGDASAVIRSGFQGNLSFLKIVRYIHWVLAYSDGVAYIDLPIAA